MDTFTAFTGIITITMLQLFFISWILVSECLEIRASVWFISRRVGGHGV